MLIHYYQVFRSKITKYFQSVDGKVQFVFKKVAVVEKFFDIIYSVHVESSTGDTQLRGRAGKHCGQKRTYRAVRYLDIILILILIWCCRV